MEKCKEDLYSVQFIVIILRMSACVQMLKHTYVLKKNMSGWSIIVVCSEKYIPYLYDVFNRL